MNVFHTRQTNILRLYIISLSVCSSPPSAPTERCLLIGGLDTVRASDTASNPALLLKASLCYHFAATPYTCTQEQY